VTLWHHHYHQFTRSCSNSWIQISTALSWVHCNSIIEHKGCQKCV